MFNLENASQQKILKRLTGIDRRLFPVLNEQSLLTRPLEVPLDKLHDIDLGKH